MEWSDEGIVLGVRRHGETSAIIELMTHGHGRHLGMVRGGAGSRLRPVLQPGNTVSAVWRARLDEHLGVYAVEGLELRAAHLMALPHALYGLGHLAGLTRLLPERDPHAALYDTLAAMLSRLDDAREAAVRMVRFELAMLGELGFGLDLSRCAASGATDDLIYVSPKSGCAVSREAGAPWRERLLRLPPFLRAPVKAGDVSDDDLIDGFALTGLFLSRHVLEPRGLAHDDARRAFMTVVTHRRGHSGPPMQNGPEQGSGPLQDFPRGADQ
ncbi:MAG: DNA repair protein RecO [Xanthobacteraceae bacterium]|nr:MAG: DNA repair protein RecO [Xanthobacteraceae bacterium]